MPAGPEANDLGFVAQVRLALVILTFESRRIDQQIFWCRFAGKWRPRAVRDVHGISLWARTESRSIATRSHWTLVLAEAELSDGQGLRAAEAKRSPRTRHDHPLRRFYPRAPFF